MHPFAEKGPAVPSMRRRARIGSTPWSMRALSTGRSGQKTSPNARRESGRERLEHEAAVLCHILEAQRDPRHAPRAIGREERKKRHGAPSYATSRPMSYGRGARLASLSLHRKRLGRYLR